MEPARSWSYSYLLGLYVGDGCVVQHPRAERLVITLDGVYPEIPPPDVATLDEFIGPKR